MSEHQKTDKPVHNDPADATGNRNIPRTTEKSIPAEGSFRDAESTSLAVESGSALKDQEENATDPNHMDGSPEKA